MNSARLIKTLVKANTRQITQSVALQSKNEVHPGYKRIKELQKKFQIDDGLPVHLKGGVMDKILYQATMGLCMIAAVFNFKLIYDLAYPKKPE